MNKADEKREFRIALTISVAAGFVALVLFLFTHDLSWENAWRAFLCGLFSAVGVLYIIFMVCSEDGKQKA